MYDYASKLFISSGEIDHDTAEDLQDLKKIWLKIPVSWLTYRILTNSNPIIY